MRRPALVGLLAILAARPAAAPPPILACIHGGRPVARWELPPVFREVSGLALAPDGRLFLHGDERGIVGVIDTATGRLTATYQLGTPAARADFEDIAIIGDTLVLTTSDGVLAQAPLPRPGQGNAVLPFVVVETGIGARCEVEGLALDPRERTLLFGCKTSRAPELGRDAAIFRWSFERRAMASPDRIVLPARELAAHHKLKGFHTSALTIDPRSGELVLVASADQSMAVADRAGKVLGVGPVPRRHRQPEGLAIARNGTVYLGDEGGRGPGSITVYSCR